MSRDNAAASPGGSNALINYFHAYVINPSKPNETVNLPAAQAFVSLLTSPSVQGQIAQYLNTTTDPGGAPFKPTASPAISVAGLPSGTLTAGTPVTVTGTVSNQQPGFAAPANQPVTLDQLVGGLPVAVASGTTNASGGYSITFTPSSSGTYQVATGAISLVENSTLSPVYGDVLSPGASATSTVTLQATATIGKLTTSAGTVTAAGSINPVAPDASATATLLARPQSSKGAYKVIGTQTLAKGQAAYGVNGALNGGKWSVEVQYSDPGQLVTATTAASNVTVPAHSVTVKFGKVKIKQGKVTFTGKVSQAPIGSSAKVRLLARSAGTVKVNKAKSKKKTTHKKPTHKKPTHKKPKHGTKKTTRATRVTADVKLKSALRQVGKVTLKQGKVSYKLTHTFKRGHLYIVQLQYVHKGQTTTSSRIVTIAVH